jgi:hypothetical protein
MEYLVMKAMLPLLFLVVAGSCIAGSAGQLPALKANRWVNSLPLTAEDLRGKIVLVDFWEYTCINWIRTSPYVKAWNRDYATLGLVVVGVHAPEFDFGKRAENIDRGIRDHRLTYPIAIDNDFAIWRTFENNAWPAKYLFDSEGRLVKRWVGEGGYDEIETEIRRLLTAALPGIQLPAVSSEVTAFAKTNPPSHRGITNETYIGDERRDPGALTLEGDWLYARQYIELRKGAGRITLPFTASEVNLVMQPGPSGSAAVAVLLDGKPIGDARGTDVGTDSVARFDRSGMIRLVYRAPMGRHVLTVVASDPGLRAFVFTFGS